MRSIVLLVVVVAISLLVGIAVTGLPQSVPDDVVSGEISATTAESRTSTTTLASTTTTVIRRTATSTPMTSPLPVTPATAPPTTTSLAPIATVRVVVANASNASGIARRTADQLGDLGYTAVSSTDATTPRPDTVVVFAPGYEAEAARLAEQLQLTPQQITPQPLSPLTTNDIPGDLWVLLGLDRS